MKRLVLTPRALLKSESYQGVVSLTEPNQVQDLQTLIKNRNRGISPQFFNGSFSQFDTEDIHKMDFVELAELREKVQEQVKELEADHHGLTVQLEKKRRELVNQRLDAIAKKVQEEENASE